MNIHYTGRQVEVSPLVRTQVETRLSKLHKVLGRRPPLETHVTLSQERHRHVVELTMNFRDHALVGAARTPDLHISLHRALNRLERQVLKHKARLRVKKRHARPPAARSIRTLRPRPAA